MAISAVSFLINIRWSDVPKLNDSVGFVPLKEFLLQLNDDLLYFPISASVNRLSNITRRSLSNSLALLRLGELI